MNTRIRNIWERIRALWQRASKLAGQFYTPRELRALLLFVLAGVAILIFRFGRWEYLEYFPNQRDTNQILQQHRSDSLFFALSAAANQRDSLFFSLPEDSLLPPSVRNRTEHHSKVEGLMPHSVSLNLGTKEDLIRLPSVGPASAERILSYREERGRFRTLEEIENIQGFGVTRFEKIKPYLRLN